MEFRQVPGFPNYVACSDGTLWSYASGEALEIQGVPKKDGGYLNVTLCNNGSRVTRTLHSVIAEAFYGPRPKEMECCHNDGDPTNCALSNLRYDTRKSNQADRVTHGTHCRGERCKTSKLTADDVRYIRRSYPGVTMKSLSIELGVTVANISLIIKRRSWAHLP